MGDGPDSALRALRHVKVLDLQRRACPSCMGRRMAEGYDPPLVS